MFDKKVFFMLTKSIYIIGAGAYGCALGQVFSERFDVIMLANNSSVANCLNEMHCHPVVLNGVHLSKNISCCCDYSRINEADTILICTPVSAVRDVCSTLKSSGLDSNANIILCSKGIEINTGKFTSEIASEILQNEISVLSGPSFAEEIAKGLPAAVSLASHAPHTAQKLSEQLTTQLFKVYPNTDLIGTQICGAFKNVLAILCGVFYGLNLGESAVAFLITKALEEMKIFISRAGGEPSTVDQVCGIGDVILTCTNEASRNMSFGRFIANGGSLETWNGNLAEGAFTARITPELLAKYNCESEIKIFKMVYQLIYKHENPEKLIKQTLLV